MPAESDIVVAMLKLEQEQRNTWASIRYRFREPIAEFLGTMILMIFGTAVDCQVTLSANRAVAPSQKGDSFTTYLGWGAGAAFGTWAAMGVSGGHLNPAVTLVNVLFRGLSWRKLLVYIPAQIAGAFFGSLIVYGVYWDAINVFEGGSAVRTIPGTASMFATFPMDYASSATCFFSEVLATAMLIMGIFALTDKKNGAPPGPFIPLMVFILVTALSACMSMQTGAAMNPARDLGPRLMTAIFYGRTVWTYRNYYWLWTPIIAVLLGAALGAGIYDVLIYTDDDSPINRRRGRPYLPPSGAGTRANSPTRCHTPDDLSLKVAMQV